jgi:hypothetical protein
METRETFAIGVGGRKRTAAEKRAAHRQKLDAQRRERLKRESKIMERLYKARALRRPEPLYLNLLDKQWLILPDVPAEMRSTIYWAGKNIVQIMTTLSKKRNKTCKKIAIQNQRLRNAFSALARAWILKKARQGNDEDLVTGEMPANPIILLDWASRTKYVFEPTTIRKDIVSRLLASTATFFPKPQCPRNPYTNMALTDGQLDSIIRQLRAKGCTHWAIEALYSSGYFINIFKDEMYMKLKSNILKNIFTDHGNSEGITVTLEFIEDRFNGNGIIFNEDAYRWALENKQSHPHLSAWRSLAYMHHKDRANDVKEEYISRQARALCLASECIKTLYDHSSSNSNSSADTP